MGKGVWISLFALIFDGLFFVPNLICYLTRPRERYRSQNVVVWILNLVGYAAAVFTGIFWLESRSRGFYSIAEFLLFFLGSIGLILANWAVWTAYVIVFRPSRSGEPERDRPEKSGRGRAVFWAVMAALPVCLFLLQGISQRYPALIVCGVVFAAGHLLTVCERIRNGKHAVV